MIFRRKPTAPPPLVIDDTPDQRVRIVQVDDAKWEWDVQYRTVRYGWRSAVDAYSGREDTYEEAVAASTEAFCTFQKRQSWRENAVTFTPDCECGEKP